MDLHEVGSYRRAASRADLLLQAGEVPLAGGTWLFSEPQPGVTGLVDLAALGWPAWECTDDGITIAATCTVEQLLAVPWGTAVTTTESTGIARLVQKSVDSFLMSFKIQHTATVGGNLVLALPAGAMIALTAALDGVALIWTPDGGERREPVETFVRDVRTTGLQQGEILRAVEIPARALGSRAAMRQISLATLGRSSALVIGRVDRDGAATLTVTAATTRPVVLRFPSLPTAEVLLDTLETVDCWYADPHGPADWRRSVTGTLAAEVRAELAHEREPEPERERGR